MENKFWMVWRDQYLLMNIFKWNRPKTSYGKSSASTAVNMDYWQFFEYTPTDEIDHDYYEENVLGLAIKYNKPKVEQWMIKNNKSTQFWVIDWAVNKKDLQMVIELHRRGYTGTIYTMYNAALNGDLVMLRYLYNYGYPITKCVINFCENRHCTKIAAFINSVYRPRKRRLTIKVTELYPPDNDNEEETLTVHN